MNIMSRNSYSEEHILYNTAETVNLKGDLKEQADRVYILNNSDIHLFIV